MKNNFLRGMSHGIPIFLGYLSVSFGLGIFAVSKAGLSVFQLDRLMKMHGLSSADQDLSASPGAVFPRTKSRTRSPYQSAVTISAVSAKARR